MLSQGRWFSPGTPASSTTKTGRHDIAESGVKHHNSNSYLIEQVSFSEEYTGGDWVHTLSNENIVFISLDDGIFWARLIPFISDIV